MRQSSGKTWAFPQIHVFPKLCRVVQVSHTCLAQRVASFAQKTTRAWDITIRNSSASRRNCGRQPGISVQLVHLARCAPRSAGPGDHVGHSPVPRRHQMHAGDRSAEAIDAGQVLPGYQGVIVRDGYAGYGHLATALHAWCGVHPSDRH